MNLNIRIWKIWTPYLADDIAFLGGWHVLLVDMNTGNGHQYLTTPLCASFCVTGTTIRESPHPFSYLVDGGNYDATLVSRWNWTAKAHISKTTTFSKGNRMFSQFRFLMSSKTQKVANRLIKGFCDWKIEQPQTSRTPRSGVRRMEYSTTHPWTGVAGGLPSTWYFRKISKNNRFLKHFRSLGKTTPL